MVTVTVARRRRRSCRLPERVDRREPVGHVRNGGIDVTVVFVLVAGVTWWSAAWWWSAAGTWSARSSWAARAGLDEHVVEVRAGVERGHADTARGELAVGGLASAAPLTDRAAWCGDLQPQLYHVLTVTVSGAEASVVDEPPTSFFSSATLPDRIAR